MSLQPVIDKEVDMTIGIFKSGRGSTDLAKKSRLFIGSEGNI